MKRQHAVSSKDLEVTLMLELNYPHVETKQNRNFSYCETFASKVMKQTDTVIYCSECTNTASDELTKPNAQRFHYLYIEGSLANVDSARPLIRDRVPIEFVVGCRADRVDSIGKQLLIAHFSATFGVTISFSLIAEDASYQVNIRGYRYALGRLKEAALHFCHLLQTPAESVGMDIGASQLHVELVRNCAALVEERSQARICCPPDNSAILVRGSLETSHLASEILTGVTPLHLKFRLPSTVGVERFRSIARMMDINITESKTMSGCEEIVLSTYEWNARHLYELRRIGLGLNHCLSVLPTLNPIWIDLIDLHNTFRDSASAVPIAFEIIKNGNYGASCELQCSERLLEGRNSSNESPILRHV